MGGRGREKERERERYKPIMDIYKTHKTHVWLNTYS